MNSRPMAAPRPSLTVAALVAALACALGLAALATFPQASAAQERAFELVTPVGANANIRVNGGLVSDNGDTVCYATEDRMAGSTGDGTGFNDDTFCSYRGADGWQTKWLSGPRPSGKLGAYGMRTTFLSGDGQKAIFVGNSLIAGFPDWTGPTDPDELPEYSVPNSNNTGFLYDNATEGLTWVTPRPKPLREQGTLVVAASDTLDHALFSSTLALVPEDTTSEEDPDVIHPPEDVYLWTREDGLKLISADENGLPLHAGGASFAMRSGGEAVQGTLSSDGSRIFFCTNPGAGAGNCPSTSSDWYMWEDDQATNLGLRRGPVGEPESSIYFSGASLDGDIVYFHSDEQLTSTAKEFGTALYRYTVATDELEQVVTLPGGVTPLAVSGDGSTVLYRAALSLYAYRNGASTLVQPLVIGDLATPQRVAAPILPWRAVRISHDGTRAIYVSENGTPGIAQVFLWDADDGVTRLSTDSETGDPAAKSATIGNYAELPLQFSERSDLDVQTTWSNRGSAWTDDYEAVYFDTADSLLPEDQNEVHDVYEWRDGDLTLISAGIPGARSASYYADNSADGSTVAFTTYERVLPASDRNPTRDLYVSRAGGGFPDPPPSTVGDPPADSPPGAAPPRRGVGSGTARDGEQASPGARQSVVLRKLGSAGLKRLARRGSVGVTVTLARAGRVEVRATAKVRGKRRTVGRASKRIGAKGARVVVRLSAAARRQLRSKGQLRVTLTATAPGAPNKRASVLLRLSATAAAGSVADDSKRG